MNDHCEQHGTYKFDCPACYSKRLTFAEDCRRKEAERRYSDVECPACGGKTEFDTTTDYEELGSTTYWFLVCQSCRTRTKSFGPYSTKKDIEAVWQNTKLKADVEELRRQIDSLDTPFCLGCGATKGHAHEHYCKIWQWFEDNAAKEGRK